MRENPVSPTRLSPCGDAVGWKRFAGLSPNPWLPAGLTSPLLQELHLRRIVHAISARGSGPVTTSVSHPSSRCTSFNLAAMSISCEQVGRQSPQPTQDVPFRVKAAYSLRARSRS